MKQTGFMSIVSFLSEGNRETLHSQYHLVFNLFSLLQSTSLELITKSLVFFNHFIIIVEFNEIKFLKVLSLNNF